MLPAPPLHSMELLRPISIYFPDVPDIEPPRRPSLLRHGWKRRIGVAGRLSLGTFHTHMQRGWISGEKNTRKHFVSYCLCDSTFRTLVGYVANAHRISGQWVGNTSAFDLLTDEMLEVVAYGIAGWHGKNLRKFIFQILSIFDNPCKDWR
jgi:hypothetical protein